MNYCCLYPYFDWSETSTLILAKQYDHCLMVYLYGFVWSCISLLFILFTPHCLNCLFYIFVIWLNGFLWLPCQIKVKYHCHYQFLGSLNRLYFSNANELVCLLVQFEYSYWIFFFFFLNCNGWTICLGREAMVDCLLEIQIINYRFCF